MRFASAFSSGPSTLEQSRRACYLSPFCYRDAHWLCPARLLAAWDLGLSPARCLCAALGQSRARAPALRPCAARIRAAALVFFQGREHCRLSAPCHRVVNRTDLDGPGRLFRSPDSARFTGRIRGRWPRLDSETHSGPTRQPADLRVSGAAGLDSGLNRGVLRVHT
jgi:hypothetical protein